MHGRYLRESYPGRGFSLSGLRETLTQYEVYRKWGVKEKNSRWKRPYLEEEYTDMEWNWAWPGYTTPYVGRMMHIPRIPWRPNPWQFEGMFGGSGNGPVKGCEDPPHCEYIHLWPDEEICSGEEFEIRPLISVWSCTSLPGTPIPTWVYGWQRGVEIDTVDPRFGWFKAGKLPAGTSSVKCYVCAGISVGSAPLTVVRKSRDVVGGTKRSATVTAECTDCVTIEITACGDCCSEGAPVWTSGNATGAQSTTWTGTVQLGPSCGMGSVTVTGTGFSLNSYYKSDPAANEWTVLVDLSGTACGTGKVTATDDCATGGRSADREIRCTTGSWQTCNEGSEPDCTDGTGGCGCDSCADSTLWCYGFGAWHQDGGFQARMSAYRSFRGCLTGKKTTTRCYLHQDTGRKLSCTAAMSLAGDCWNSGTPYTCHTSECNAACGGVCYECVYRDVEVQCWRC